MTLRRLGLFLLTFTLSLFMNHATSIAKDQPWTLHCLKDLMDDQIRCAATKSVSDQRTGRLLLVLVMLPARTVIVMLESPIKAAGATIRVDKEKALSTRDCDEQGCTWAEEDSRLLVDQFLSGAELLVEYVLPSGKAIAPLRIPLAEFAGLLRSASGRQIRP